MTAGRRLVLAIGVLVAALVCLAAQAGAADRSISPPSYQETRLGRAELRPTGAKVKHASEAPTRAGGSCDRNESMGAAPRCSATDAHGECSEALNSTYQPATSRTALRFVATNSVGASSKGLVGAGYEEFLGTNLGGRTNVSYGGRQFEVELPGTNGMGSTLIEAKSGNYWNDVVSTPQGLAKFQHDIGSRTAIARSQGSSFVVYSNTPIPASVQAWLTSRGSPFKVL
jgi:hypothetical protein